jgi:hypothetical protein
MRRYSEAAVERAMKVQEVLVRAMGGQISWLQGTEPKLAEGERRVVDLTGIEPVTS